LSHTLPTFSANFQVDAVGATWQAPSMAQKLRLQYPGAIYHLMKRDDRWEPAFLDIADRSLFASLNGLVSGWRWGRGNRSIGFFLNTATQDVDLLGTP